MEVEGLSLNQYGRALMRDLRENRQPELRQLEQRKELRAFLEQTQDEAQDLHDQLRAKLYAQSPGPQERYLDAVPHRELHERTIREVVMDQVILHRGERLLTEGWEQSQEDPEEEREELELVSAADLRGPPGEPDPDEPPPLV